MGDIVENKHATGDKTPVVIEEFLLDEQANAVNSDPFATLQEFQPSGPPWKQLTAGEKFKRVFITICKLILLLGLLYMFICSLGFLSSAFRLLSGKAAGQAFSSNEIMSNPIAGLMIGVVATVLLQSSSTSTSIVVAMVASNLIQVSQAIPIVMGANIGTSVTNTIVAIGQISDRDQFRRAFAGATVHDMFNILAVVVLLPLEIATKYLFRLTKAIIEAMELTTDKSLKQEMLKKITKPFTNLIIRLDKKVIEGIAVGNPEAMKKSLIKYWCDKGVKVLEANQVTKLANVSKINALNETSYSLANVTEWQNKTITKYSEPCKFAFHDTGLSDTIVGVIMLAVALLILCVCLILIVKTLHSLLKGQIAIVIRKTFNSDFPKPFGFLTGYVAILVGAGMTILVQSSSIFTSALTPLVGLGLVSVERVYPLSLGANIGTTATGVLAALASSSDRLAPSIQIALCHLFFNISGILLWYPIPQLRRIPIKLAKYLGNTTAEYRWFAVMYLIVVFFVTPGTIFALSLAGWIVFAVVLIPVSVIIVFVVIINILQAKQPGCLPSTLRTWDWLPRPLRSLEPYDALFTRLSCKKKSFRLDEDVENANSGL